MASGNDARLGIIKETTYATRVAPTRFFPFTAESLAFQYNRYFSQALGSGRWARPSITTTKSGTGSLNGEVPTTGFGYLLQFLHGNTVVPVQDAATISYTQTHTLDTPPDKSATIQVQTPPVSTSTLLPQDLLGVMFSGLTLSWDAAGVLTWEMPCVINNLSTAETLATYTAPTAWSMLSFAGGSLTIGGVAQTDITGSGSVTIGQSRRDDSFALGTSGTMAKPTETAKPTAGGSFTADFNDLAHFNRVVNDTSADVVLKFEGATIASTYKYTMQVTIPACKFSQPRPQVGGPGPVTQEVSFENSAGTSQPPVLVYRSTDTTL
jgi:hypothetical protein